MTPLGSTLTASFTLTYTRSHTFISPLLSFPLCWLYGLNWNFRNKQGLQLGVPKLYYHYWHAWTNFRVQIHLKLDSMHYDTFKLNEPSQEWLIVNPFGKFEFTNVSPLDSYVYAICGGGVSSSCQWCWCIQNSKKHRNATFYIWIMDNFLHCMEAIGFKVYPLK